METKTVNNWFGSGCTSELVNVHLALQRIKGCPVAHTEVEQNDQPTSFQVSTTGPLSIDCDTFRIDDF